MRVKVDAGRHMRVECPVLIPLNPSDRDFPTAVKSTITGKVFPCQLVEERDGRRLLVFVIDFLPAGKVDILEGVDYDVAGGVEVKRDDYKVDFLSDGNLITTFNFSGEYSKPFFFPVLGPYNSHITRSFPMAVVEGEQADHPHHRSMWTAHGDVNGVDFWSEGEGCGRQSHVAFLDLEGGPVLGKMTSLVDWLDNGGERVLLESKKVVFYKTTHHLKIIDYEISLFAVEKDVRFGDTKEGGLLSVRMATRLCEDMGGRIENSFGGIGEQETWGRRAHWCNYSGPVDDEVLGIAILDHPSNPRHPTYWHVRSYGLFAANPFGISAFTGNDRVSGELLLKAGTKVTFRYRVVLHLGYAWEANIPSRFIDYVFPPRVELET
jgi:hypothetical protein